jgi:catechol 2,3-dioxygenase-like lactoylglutathione lyase family enzyme
MGRKMIQRQLFVIVLALLIFTSLVRAQTLPATTAPNFQITGLSHIAIYCSDIEKSRNFYKNVLGLEEPYSLNRPDGSLHLTFMKINDTQTIELFTIPTPTPANLPRTYHMAIETDNAEALRAHLEANKIKVPKTVPTGRIGNLNFTIPDLDGHLLEIVQYAPESWTVREKGKFLPASRLVTRLDHLIVPVRKNFDNTRAFYVDILHFKEVPDADNKVLRLQLPNSTDYLKFILYKDLPDEHQQPLTQLYIGLTSPDVANAQKVLKEKSVPTTAESADRSFTINDPDTNQITVFQKP